MNITVHEWWLHNGRAGTCIEIREYEHAGYGMEPSGHIFPQVRMKLLRWFHPFDGSTPVRITPT